MSGFSAPFGLGLKEFGEEMHFVAAETSDGVTLTIRDPRPPNVGSTYNLLIEHADPFNALVVFREQINSDSC